MNENVATAWGLFWVVLPFVLSPVLMVVASRWVMRRSAAEGFAYYFVPLAADVHDDVELISDRHH